MNENKLLSIVNQLNKSQIVFLKKYLNSQFVTKDTHVKRLLFFLLNNKLAIGNPHNKNTIHLYVYPDLTFKDLRVRHLLWRANEALEYFMLLYSVLSGSQDKNILIADFLLDNALPDIAKQYYNKAVCDIENSTIQNSQYFFRNYYLHLRLFEIESGNIRSKDLNLQQVQNNLSIFTILETLKCACIIQSHLRISDSRLDVVFLEHILNEVHISSFFNLPQIKIYHTIYLLLTADDESNFKGFIQYIKKHEHLFSNHDLNYIYKMTINFCIRMSNQNKLEYNKVAFNVYTYSIKKRYFIENNQIHRFTLTNAIALGIKTKNFKASELLLNECSQYIETAYQQNTIDFNKAKLFFAKKEYNNALKILLTNEFKDLIWNLNAKYITLKILFELNDLDAFDIHIKAFKLYIKRRSNIGYHKAYFSDVCKAFTYLRKAVCNPGYITNHHLPVDTPDLEWFQLQLVKRDILVLK